MNHIDNEFISYQNKIIRDNKKNMVNFQGTDDQITFINYSHNCCICFVDIVNSTMTISEIKGSNQIRKYYSIFLNTMASIIKENNGKVIKNFGDCLLYYFPRTVQPWNEFAFQDVIECGLAMLEANEKLNITLKQNGLPTIKYRISGNYGMVELALSINSFNVDVFGKPVNVCSKINHLASSNEFIINGDLFQIMKKMPYYMNYVIKEVNRSYCGNNTKKSSQIVYSVCRFGDERERKETVYERERKIVNVRRTRQNQDNSSFNILLVDDDEDILFTFNHIINNEGYHIESFSDPSEFLNHFVQSSSYFYDLAIMDIRMPKLNGIRLYSFIKIINPDIKVLFVTALNATDELLSIFPDIQPSEIIRKPVEPNILVSQIGSILRDK